MLNNDLKSEALQALELAVRHYESVFWRVTSKSEELYKKRCETSDYVIKACEDYINMLANSPKEFDKSVADFKVEYGRFVELAMVVCRRLEELPKEIEVEAGKNEQLSSAVAVSGVAAGASFAALAPAAAMAIATTFGTASTGIAISTLSGAAATSAALAWLGGGALAAGGGGMTAGYALLGLAGPVGLAIGGVALVGSFFLVHQKNAETEEKVIQETVKEIQSVTKQLLAAEREIDRVLSLTRELISGILQQLRSLIKEAPKDYCRFTPSQKEMLAALINNIESLSKLLNQRIA